ncbi:MAG TPA: MarR family winged helix-turn-helix transcriptional regulator [Solirubrobacteraceae bacterium]|nr:MarR family winged helix-turn-helix transcriptional regulator [Solirubrobacteraceae bacterium]
MKFDTKFGEERGNGQSPAGVAPAQVVDTPCSLDPDPGPDAPRPAVGFTVSSLGYAIARRFRETLAPLELEPREFALLRAVGAAEGQSQQAIGERLAIPPSRMVAFVDALQARSLLERRHNPLDRRARALYLTASGRELLERAFVLSAELERELCAQLSDSERGQLLALLRRVSEQLGLGTDTHGAHAHSALADE